MSVRPWFVGSLFAVGSLVAAGRVPFVISETASAAPPAQDTSTLADQTELSVTVYNSDIALVRDVRQVHAAARHVRSRVPGHRGHGQSRHCALPIADRTVARRRARAELRVRPARARQAPAQVRRPRGDARARASRRRDARGGSEGQAPQLQQRAGLADRRRDRHRPWRRSHPLSRAARQSALAADADLVAREHGRRSAIASRRRTSLAS